MTKTDLILYKAALIIQDLDSKYGLTNEEINRLSEIIGEAIKAGKENENNEEL